MKLAVVVLAGAADLPLEELGDRTPLAAARLPCLRALAAGARTCGVRTIPKKAPATVETALLTLLGDDPLRAPPEAGGIGATFRDLRLAPGEIAFRCDLVNLYDGAVADPTAGRIEGKQAEILFEYLQAEVGSASVRFLPLDRWRGLLVVGEGQAAETRTTPLSSFLGEPLDENLPRGPGSELLRGLIGRAAERLASHEINAVRVDLGENPANGIWIWGGGTPRGREAVPGGGAAVGSHPGFLGLAREKGLTPVRVAPGPDGLAEPAAAAAAAVAAVDASDLVVVCLEGALLASRAGDVAAKVAFLEAADRELIRPLEERVLPGGRLLVVASHAASSGRRREVSSIVPFLLAGEGSSALGSAPFAEEAAEASDLVVERGHELLEYARRA